MAQKCLNGIGVRCMTMRILNFKMVMRLVFFYCFAGGLYMTLELICRQRTEYHMFYLAGTVGLLLLVINELLSYNTDFIIQVIVGGSAAIIGELICGLLFNRDFHIWDYRNLPYNFMGQIQLYFGLLWYLLTGISIPILDYIDYNMFPRRGVEKPYYTIFGRRL